MTASVPVAPYPPQSANPPGLAPSGATASLPRRSAALAPRAGSLSEATPAAPGSAPVSTAAASQADVGANRATKQRRTSVGGRPLSKRDVLLLVTQLSIMVRSGVDLAEAVRSISARSTRAPIREAMAEVYASLECGCLLSQALADQRDRFGGAVVASIAAGESSGRLPEVLTRLGVVIRDQLRLQSAVRSVISYPLVLALVTMLVLAAMVFFVLPQFAGIYEASRAPTPAITRLLLDAAQVAQSYWWLLLGMGAFGAFVAVRFARTAAGRRRIDLLCFRLPVVRKFTRSLLAGRVFRLQGIMLESGVPMLEVLRMTRPSAGNSCFEDLIDQMQTSLINGEGMAAALRDSTCVPDGAAEMVATAEANGQLGSVLQSVGEFYESEGEQYLRDAVKIAEPAIIVGLGMIVGVIVLAVMLPLLDLSTAAM